MIPDGPSTKPLPTQASASPNPPASADAAPASHTPTPWVAWPDADGFVIVRAGTMRENGLQADWIAELSPDANGHSLEEDRANTDLIVRAVNAHADLLAELRRCSDMLSAVASDMEDGGSLDTLRGKYITALVNARDDARAAIQKARGQ